MTFGPDNQPYFGGQRVVNTFLGHPRRQAGRHVAAVHHVGAAVAANVSDFALPTRPAGLPVPEGPGTRQLNGRPWRASPTLRTAAAPRLANAGFTSALVTQPSSFTHVAADGTGYMYTGPLGGTIVQAQLGNDVAGRTTYRFRTYLTGISLTTGIGVADDLGSLMVMTDPSAIGLAGQEVVTKLPLCEDM